MARILYGVHGSGHGHAIRALSVARRFPEHDFLFVSYGSGAAILRQEYPVVEVPGIETAYLGHRVAWGATLYRNCLVLGGRKQVVRRFLELMDRFQPEVAISDYESFLPQACLVVGLPCLSLDHEHVITCSPHPVPGRQIPNYVLTAGVVRLLFSRATAYVVNSFFRPPIKANALPVKLLPSLLRESVAAREPREGDHVLAYQGFPTFKKFFPFLRNIRRPVVVYGFDRDHTEGNLRFKKNSEPGLLDDLASSSYVICGGGHTLISEALHYGKPIISFPIRGAFEQFLNAFYVQRLGYGRYFTGFRPPSRLIPAFEARLDHYRHQIRQGSFCGNQETFHLVDRFIRRKRLDP